MGSIDTRGSAALGHRFDPAHMDRLLDPARREYQDPDLILAHLPLARVEGVADIGCGPGFFTLDLARRVPAGAVVYAVDVAQEMLDRVAARAQEAGLDNIRTVLAEEDDEYPIHSATCDAVLMANVYHETDPASNLLHELRRILKPGGVLLLVEWRPEPTPKGPPLEERLQPADVIEEFTLSGFALDGPVEAGPFHYGFRFVSSGG